MALKVDSVSKLFETPNKPVDFKEARKDIPRQDDPLLREIMERESKVVEASMKGPGALESTLKAERFQAVTSIKVNKNPKPEREIPVWEQDRSQMRMCMDHDTWKVNAALTKNVKSAQDPHAWTSYTTNVKTCTSVLSSQDATFCGGSRGALVYLAPSSPSALVAAAPCDVVSPSETHQGNTAYFKSARTTTRAYCADQFKYHVAFDLVRHVKTQCIEILKTISDSNAAEALWAIQLKAEPIFDKKFYTLEDQESNLEKEIQHIMWAMEAYPELEGKIGHTCQEFIELKQKVHDYLNNPKVVKRGVQNQQTTGWQLSSASDESHPLLPLARCSHLRLRKLNEKLAQTGIVITELCTYPGEEDLDPEKAKEFIDKHSDQFQQQIHRNAVAGYTVTEAVNEKAKRQKTTLQHLDAIETRAQTLASTATSPTAKELQDVVSKAKKPVEKLYTEIQLRSKKLKVSGFGIKKEILDQIKSPMFEGTLNLYHSIKKERKLVEAQLTQAELELTALKAAQAPAMSLEGKESEIAGLKSQKDELDGQIAKLQADPALASYRLMNAAHKRNLPSFVHYGE
ncbi:MAG: hypothetical protein JSR39_00005 [Verrucomicrobia bacterium]|nr:hypothetical protein [Verrucomicrobiota bacterium]